MRLVYQSQSRALLLPRSLCGQPKKINLVGISFKHTESYQQGSKTFGSSTPKTYNYHGYINLLLTTPTMSRLHHLRRQQ
jgi:hypothetical protein